MLHNRVEENWLWANGHHPFGPFSNCTGLSDLLLDTSLRNAIFSRVDTAIRGVRDSVQVRFFGRKSDAYDILE